MVHLTSGQRAPPWPMDTPDSLPTHGFKSPSPELDARAAENAFVLFPPVRNNNPANAGQLDLAHSLHTTPPTLAPEAGPPTLPSVCPHKQPLHSAFTSLQINGGIPLLSGVRADVDSSVQQTAAAECAGIAPAYPTSLTLSTREQVARHSVEHVFSSPESSWMPRQAASSPTTNSHAVALPSISSASNVTPLPLSAQPKQFSTAISEVSSTSMGAAQPPTSNPGQSPVPDPSTPDERAPKESATGPTAGSDDNYIVRSEH